MPEVITGTRCQSLSMLKNQANKYKNKIIILFQLDKWLSFPLSEKHFFYTFFAHFAEICWISKFMNCWTSQLFERHFEPFKCIQERTKNHRECSGVKKWVSFICDSQCFMICKMQRTETFFFSIVRITKFVIKMMICNGNIIFCFIKSWNCNCFIPKIVRFPFFKKKNVFRKKIFSNKNVFRTKLFCSECIDALSVFMWNQRMYKRFSAEWKRLFKVKNAQSSNRRSIK